LKCRVTLPRVAAAAVRGRPRPPGRRQGRRPRPGPLGSSRRRADGSSSASVSTARPLPVGAWASRALIRASASEKRSLRALRLASPGGSGL
jgi:hypothetical protein